MNIIKEIKYIIKRGLTNDARKVQLGDLVLFSTQTGDAWLLDTEDTLAICLLKDKKKQKFKLIDTPTQFGFDWEYKYTIDNECFIVIDKEGIERKILGYPIEYLK